MNKAQIEAPSLLERIASLESRERKLREALEPFAKYEDALQRTDRWQVRDESIVVENDADGPYAKLTRGDLRQAKAALPQGEGKEKP